MKKEDLVSLGLTEEQQAEVFKLNGLAIEQYKTENSNLIAKIEGLETNEKTLSEQLETANNKIQEFTKLDIEAIKNEAQDYKAKFEQSEAEREQTIKDMNLNHSLETGLIKAGAKNTKAVKALLDIENLKVSQNLNTDIEEAINALKESDAYLFNSNNDELFITGEQQLQSKDMKDMTYDEMLEANKKGLI